MPQYVGPTCRGVARRAKTETDADTQLTVFESFASDKQLLIFSCFRPLGIAEGLCGRKPRPQSLLDVSRLGVIRCSLVSFLIKLAGLTSSGKADT